MQFEKPSKDYAAYIFDCDGTLADSMESHYISWVEAFKKNKAKFHFDHDLFISMGGITLLETVRILNTKFGDHLDPEQVVHDKEVIYMQNIHHTVAKDEVVAFAKELAKKKSPMAVASGGTRNTVHKTLEYIGIKELFPVILTQEDVINGKPAPDIFLLAAKKLKAETKECLVFEDSKSGFKAAEAAGMDYVQVF